MQLLHIVILLMCHRLANGMVLLAVRVCDLKRQNIYNLTGKIENGIIKDAVSSISRDIGNLPADITVMYSKDGNTFMSLTSMTSNNICADYNMYLGDSWVGYQKAARMPHPGKCPIEKGRYFLKEYKPNLNQPGWQALPKGIVRLTVKIYDGQKKNELSCVHIEALNS